MESCSNGYMRKVVGMREWRFKPFSMVCMGLYWFGVKMACNAVFGPNRACSMPIATIPPPRPHHTHIPPSSNFVAELQIVR